MKEKIALLSILANLFLAIGKVLAGLITGSMVVLAEGIHSSMDVLSSVISLAGIKIAKKPVDDNHPYGHYKFEVLAGLIITLILFVTGIEIVYEAYKKFAAPSLLKINYLALAVMFISVLVNLVMARLKIHYGKKENSISLLSDGWHSRLDVWSSMVIFLGLILVRYWVHFDALLAVLVGLYIIKESFDLGKEASESLLDVSAGKEIEEQIKKIVIAHQIELADLKTQKKGSAVTANLEIKLPSEVKVEEAAKIIDQLKQGLIKKINSLEYVAIQIESLDVSSNSFMPHGVLANLGLNRSFSWQGRGKFKQTNLSAQGKGPDGYCLCKKCGYKILHQRGAPCSSLKCPECGAVLIRKN